MDPMPYFYYIYKKITLLVRFIIFSSIDLYYVTGFNLLMIHDSKDSKDSKSSHEEKETPILRIHA